MSMYRKQVRKLSLTQKKNLTGYIYVAPFIIGFLFFFLSPVLSSLIFSFNSITAAPGGFSMTYVGWANYDHWFNVDPNYRNDLIKNLIKLLGTVPSVVIFSFLMANILNQQFKGRIICRLIFFLPVVLASGVMATMSNDILTQALRGDVTSNTDLNMVNSVVAVVQQMSLPASVTTYVVNLATQIYDIVNASGVQILIFIAALQTVTPSLFEASNMEGATAWENFWKITFPMVSPMILVSLIYSIVDFMSSSANSTVARAESTATDLSQAAAKSWVYFLAIFIITAIVMGIVSRFVHYENE